MGQIAGIQLGPLNDGESWDDFLTITLNRHGWHVVLAAVTQMGQNICEGIEDLEGRASQGDVVAILLRNALMESNDELRDVSLGILQVINPALFAHVKAEAQANADA